MLFSTCWIHLWRIPPVYASYPLYLAPMMLCLQCEAYILTHLLLGEN
jgi:hypothetical protein